MVQPTVLQGGESINTLTTSLRQGFCFQGYTCWSISRPEGQSRRECCGGRERTCRLSSLALNLTPPHSGWATWRKFLYHPVPRFPHLKTGAIMVSSLMPLRALSERMCGRAMENGCPWPTQASYVFSLHAYARVHVSSGHWLCLVVLERPGEGVDSCPETRWVKDCEVLGTRMHSIRQMLLLTRALDDYISGSSGCLSSGSLVIWVLRAQQFLEQG